MRSTDTAFTPSGQSRSVTFTQRQPCRRTCPLCKHTGRKDTHFLSECTFLPEQHIIYMIKGRQITHILDEIDSDSDVDDALYKQLVRIFITIEYLSVSLPT